VEQGKLTEREGLVQLTTSLCKKVNNIFNIKRSWGLYYKTFYGRNLRIFVIS
jgi:hypothetical protein